jgi:hypothetical protein
MRISEFARATKHTLVIPIEMYIWEKGALSLAKLLGVLEPWYLLFSSNNEKLYPPRWSSFFFYEKGDLSSEISRLWYSHHIWSCSGLSETVRCIIKVTKLNYHNTKRTASWLNITSSFCNTFHGNLIWSLGKMRERVYILPPIFVDLRIAQADPDCILLYPGKVLDLAE